MNRREPLELDDFWEHYVGLVGGLADFVRELSDEEVLEEFRAEGGDPALGPDEARQAMLESLRERFVVGS